MKILLKLASLCFLLTNMILAGSCSGNVNLNNFERKNVALIVKTTYGYYWSEVKQGADTAGREFNVNINYNAPDDEENIHGQVKLVEQAYENKVDTLILAPNDYKELVKVTEKAYEKHIPVIIIDSELNTDKFQSYISTDNLKAGSNAGEALVDLTQGNCRIGIINSTKGTRNAELREEGFLSVISKYPRVNVASKKYCSSDVKLAGEMTRNMLEDDTELSVIVAFDDVISEGVAETVDQMRLAEKVKVISFGSSPKVIDYMDKGIIQATITQNPFSMGYLGVKYAIDAMNGKNTPKYIDTGSKIINKENMYLPENQKLLFPFVK